MEGGLINMLIFYCTDCKKMITAADYESTDDIVDRLDEHLTKCPCRLRESTDYPNGRS
jgi:hypothetical protein